MIIPPDGMIARRHPIQILVEKSKRKIDLAQKFDALHDYLSALAKECVKKLI
jgi:hypothetical protein